MSTLKVTNIENPDGGGVSAKIADVGGGQLSNRNLIHNGAMKIAQRGTSETGVTTAKYICDRWLLALNSLGTWTVEQSTDAPAGFANSFKATCTTADASPAAGDYAIIVHRMEAQDLQHLDYGTSNAESLVLSFYVKSNKTGSASLDIMQNDNSNKQFTKGYTISAANTWEQKKITIPGDTAGLINNDNGIGLILDWWQNSGSTYTGGSHNAAWEASTNANRNANNLGVGGTNNDYFAITGVQLEVGSVATTFEHRSYGEELQKCKRYYQTVGSVFSGETEGADRFTINAEFKPEMRASPTCTVFTGRSAKIRYAGGDVSITTPTLNNTSTTIAGVWTRLTTSGRTNAKLVTGRGTGGIDAQFIQVDAEL